MHRWMERKEKRSEEKKVDGKRWSASEDEGKEKFCSLFAYYYLSLRLMRKVRTRRKVKDLTSFFFSFFKYLFDPY